MVWVRTKVGTSVSLAKGAQRLGGLIGRQLTARQALEDRATLGCRLVGGGEDRLGGDGLVEQLLDGIGPVGQAKCAEKGLDATADGRVGDAQFALELLQVASRAEEALEEGELLTGEATESPDPELTLECRAAGTAVKARDCQLALTDRTGGDDVASHLTALDLADRGAVGAQSEDPLDALARHVPALSCSADPVFGGHDRELELVVQHCDPLLAVCQEVVGIRKGLMAE